MVSVYCIVYVYITTSIYQIISVRDARFPT